MNEISSRRIRPYHLVLVLLGLFLAVSFLGGSAFWAMLGLTDDLTIEGRAETVRVVSTNQGYGWTAYGGDAQGSRYSKADQIDVSNVTSLEVVWQHQSGALNGREDVRDRTAYETTPIFVEDKLIACTQFNEIIAIAPDTGEEIWRFDPQVPTGGKPANQFTCRGVSYWKSKEENDAECSSRIFMGTVDARLISVDAQNGKLCRDFGNNGAVLIEPSVSLRWPGELQITSAPAIIDDIVITGSAIGDNLRTEAPIGTVHAFNAKTGELLWAFNPVPRKSDDPARATWSGNSADVTGHANVWSTISVDEERDLVFLPTSSPSPDYFGGNRIGDNRYANSVVALDSETGNVAWNFQTVHHDLWDYDVPAQPGLYQVWKDGAAHDVVAQVTKTGLVFVLDRETGEPFLPIEERPVPQGGVTGEVLSPTQPFPVSTPPLVNNTLDPSDAFGITLWDKLACTNAIKSLRAEGLYTPPSEQGTLAYPFTGGGANWGSAAFDPMRNLLIVNMSNVGAFVRLTKKTGDEAMSGEIEDGAEFAPMEGAPYSMQRAPLLSPLGLPCTPPPWGILAAIDLASGEIVWRQTLGTTEDLTPGGVALGLGTPAIGGPIATAGGLIFIGATMDDYLRAFDVETGRELWKGRLPAGGQATPMTYEFEGKQYVVIAAGGHGSAGTRIGDTLVAFALPE